MGGTESDGVFHVEHFLGPTKARIVPRGTYLPFSPKWAQFQIGADEIFLDFSFKILLRSQKFSTDPPLRSTNIRRFATHVETLPLQGPAGF
jgi:hypothetical protein